MVNSYINSQQFNQNQLEKLSLVLKNFHLLTGIKICVFNSDGVEIISVPEKDGAFCSYVHGSVSGRCECENSRKTAFEICKKTLSPYLYHCYMGLSECVAPIVQFDSVLGYVMIGQIPDESFDLLAQKSFKSIIEKHNLNFDNATELIKNMKRVNSEKLGAAVMILETCASYIFMNKILTEQNSFINRFDEFVENNMASEITVEILCKNLKINLMELYHLCDVFFKKTPAKRVKELRIKRASKLLSENQLTVAEIAYQTGFCDYNYFSKVFKKETGKTPTQIKKEEEV